jgi:hypothetical protein
MALSNKDSPTRYGYERGHIHFSTSLNWVR